MTSRWVVYATFDPAGRSAAYAIDQLVSYRQAGFMTMVVDTSLEVTDDRREAWLKTATVWLHRENSGYDFGSYRFGLHFLINEMHVDVDDLDLILANDSCLGPFIPMVDVLAALDVRPSERTVFGITDSEQQSYHLQSYWLYFPKGRAHLASEFLSKLPPSTTRQSAINQGELALSSYILARGYSLQPFTQSRAVVKHFSQFRGTIAAILELFLRRIFRQPRYNEVADDACLKCLLRRPAYARHINVTLAFGVQLVRNQMSPFIKRELLRANPYRDRRIQSGWNALSNETFANELRHDQSTDACPTV